MGKYVRQARMKAEKALFDSCKSIGDYEYYLRRYPNGAFVTGAIEEIKRLSSFWHKPHELFSKTKDSSEAADFTTYYVLILLLIPIFIFIFAFIILKHKQTPPAHYEDNYEEIVDSTLVDSTAIAPNTENAEEDTDASFTDPFEVEQDKFNYNNEDSNAN